MSTVIRDAVIRLKIEQTKAKLETPDVGPAKRAHEETKKAAEEVVKAEKEVVKVTKEAADAFKQFGDRTRRDTTDAARTIEYNTSQILVRFREGGEGALRMARGIAFLSASGSDDLKKLAQSVAVAQGAFDIFAGGFKLFANLGAAFGPAGIAIAGVTTAVGAGALAWRKYQADVERAAQVTKEKLKEAQQEAAKFEEEITRRFSQSARDIERRTGRALPTPTALGGPGATRAEAERRRAEELGYLQEVQRIAQQDVDRVMGTNVLRRGDRDQELEARRRLRDSLEQQLRIQEEISREEAARAQARTGLFAIGMSAITPGFLPGVAQGQIQQFEAQQREFVARMNQVLDDIALAFEKARDRVTRLERDLEAANPE